MVGDQPGNRQDIEGHPFVGPAGKLLDKALEEAGIARSRVYITKICPPRRLLQKTEKTNGSSRAAR